MTIDYAESNKLFKAQKSALTRAVKSGDKDKVIAAVRKAVSEWNGPIFDGAWPDDWHRWNIALRDATSGPGNWNGTDIDELVKQDTNKHDIAEEFTHAADDFVAQQSANTTWDMGDPEPTDITSVESTFFDDEDGRAIPFGRTFDGDWKGYVFGGKVYLSWDDLTRRFGPLRKGLT